MKKLAGILKVHQQAPETNEDHLEFIYVEAAKSEDILYRKMEDAVSEQKRIKEQQEDKEKWDKWNEVQNQD